MRGHEALIAMRHKRRKPAICFIETDFDRLDQASEWYRESPATAYVLVEAKDSLATLDLYFLVGMLVQVDGSDVHRVRAVVEAAEAAKAYRVLGAVRTAAGVVWSHDTAGVLTYVD